MEFGGGIVICIQGRDTNAVNNYLKRLYQVLNVTLFKLFFRKSRAAFFFSR